MNLAQQQNQAITLLPVLEADYDHVASVLTEAFLADPAFIYMFPESSERQNRIEWIFKRWVKAMAPRGKPMMTTDKLGVIIELPPGTSSTVSLWEQVKLGLIGAPLTLGIKGTQRFTAVDAENKKRHHADVLTPHWVIDVIGVHPSVQGRGYGGVLLSDILSRAKESSHPSYLITTNPKNLTFYKRFGFEQISGAPIMGTGPMMWSFRHA